MSAATVNEKLGQNLAEQLLNNRLQMGVFLRN